MSKTNEAAAKAAGELSVISAVAQNDKQPVPQYDSDANQKIPLTIEKNGKTYDVAIELQPINDDEYFGLIEEVQTAGKRIKNVSIEFFEPFAELGRRKSAARFGYKDRADWKTATRDTDYISAVKAYLSVTADTEVVETADLLDDDAETKIRLLSSFNGVEIETFVSFREESKADMDEFLSAVTGTPNKNALATHKKISKEKRLFALYESLQTSDENYTNRIPVWHCIEAVTAHLNASLARLGK